MAFLQLTVWDGAGEVAIGELHLEEIVTVGAGSLQSSVIPGSKRSRRMRLFADVDCYVTWGLNPTAVADGANGRALAAESPEYFAIEAGHRVAVIAR